jgi:hypothetical protein
MFELMMLVAVAVLGLSVVVIGCDLIDGVKAWDDRLVRRRMARERKARLARWSAMNKAEWDKLIDRVREGR